MNLPLDLLKVTALAGCGWAVAATLRRAPASTRHDVWLLVVLGALLAPAVEFLLPPLYLIVPTAWAPLEQQLGGRWLLVAIGLWAAGACVCIVRVLPGLLTLRRIARRTVSWASPAAAHALAVARQLAGVRRAVTLILSDAVQVPATWGVRRPVILLPAAAARWTPERLRLVLLHELVHVRRQDVVVEALVWVAGTLYWFHPAVWLTTARLRLERERSCDEAVLATGARASDYCGHLVEIMRAATRQLRGVVVGTAMATPCTLERRVRAMLGRAPGATRGAAPSSRRWGAALVLAGAIGIYAVGTLAFCSDTGATPPPAALP